MCSVKNRTAVGAAEDHKTLAGASDNVVFRFDEVYHF